ncbi:MAG: aminoacyl-tRNA deacylase [Chloroflexi bacterium]|nr:aminoacyl-tRNA deacylase [Chloroflexota bacterium]
MAIKNNVTRMLDKRGIAYTAYELPPEKLGAQETAKRLGVDPARVFKTIVVVRSGRGKPILAVVSATQEVDVKAVARAVGEKKVHIPTQREAEQITGLQAGGISPLALLHRGFTVVLDESAREADFLHVSGGQRGLNIRMGVDDFIQLTRARVAPIGRPLS